MILTTRHTIAVTLLCVGVILLSAMGHAAEPSRCAHVAPICHVTQSPVCLCDNAWRSSCAWHCVSDEPAR